MSKVMLKLGHNFDDLGGYDEIIYPANALIPSTHQFLLDFVCADLNSLEAAAADCFTGIDFAHPSQNPIAMRPALQRVVACMEALHPIFQRSRSTLFGEIHRAFARHIAYRLSRECKERIDKRQFVSLVKSFGNEQYLDEVRLEQYLTYASRKEVATDFQMSEPIFRELATAQRTLNMLIYIVFDCTNQQFASVPVEKRASVYCAVFRSEHNPLLSINSEMSILPPHDVKYMMARIVFARSGDAEEDFYDRLSDAATQNAALPPDELVKMMDAVKQNNEDLVVEVYDTLDIHELLSYEIMTMIKEQVRVKRCKNCHGYFVADKPKVEYCDRIVAGETKPCNEIGKTRVYQKKIGADEPTFLYRKAYKTHYARVKSGRTTKGEFSTWAAEASERLALVKGGQLPLSEFKAWLYPPKKSDTNEGALHD